MAAEKPKNPHEHHRQRLKGRFLTEGLEHFEDHNVLELVLFYALPRRDTNEIAHRLLDRFGSLSGVFEASPEELAEVDGIGEYAAVFLKTYPAVAQRYFKDRFAARTKDWNYESLGKKLIIYYAGKAQEEVYAIFFDNALAICGEQKIHEGDINSAGFSMRKLVNAVVHYKASFVVLAHNHPHGLPYASNDDLHTNGVLKSLLAHMNVALLDHYIISEDHFSSMDKENFEHYIKWFREDDRSAQKKINRSKSPIDL